MKKYDRVLDFPLAVVGSGRTDAGVHARGQVANFRWPDEVPFELHRCKAALNALTGDDLAVVDIEQVPEDFDARRSAHIKCYSYRILLRPFSYGLDFGRAWYVRGNELDLAPMILAAHYFRGQHDFSGFRALDCEATTTERTMLSSELTRISRDLLVYSVIGKGFLKQMVRIMVGTLVEVGQGRIDPDTVAEILAAPDRTRAGKTAPAYGLLLDWVRYGNDWQKYWA